MPLDTLSATIDIDNLITEKPWSHTTYYLPTTATVLRWCYVKDSADSSGEDSVWIDNLSFSASDISYQSRICDALDLAESPCSMVSGPRYYSPPEFPWVITSQTSVLGGTSLRNPSRDIFQESCLALELILPINNTLIRFSFRIASEPVSDFLLIEVRNDNTTIRSSLTEGNLFNAVNRSLRNWVQVNFLTSGRSFNQLFICYTRGNSKVNNIWFDALSFTPITVAALDRELVCQALDINTEDCGIIRSVDADPPTSPWLISTTATEGDFSLRSADIDDSESSCLVLGIALSVDSDIRFSLRTDSEAVNDHLSFEAGGQELIETFAAAEDSTLRDWEPQQFLLPVGNSTLRWCYNKNGSTSSGEDSGWLDRLSFTTAGLESIEPLCEALDLFQAQCATIRSVTYNPPQAPWLSTATESAEGGLALVSPVPDTDESSCLTVEFYSPLTPDSPVVFDWRTTSQSEQDILQFRVGDQQSQIANMPEWQTQTVVIDSAETTMGWCYSQNSAADGRTARGWLDNLSVLTLTDRYTLEIVVSTSVTQSAPDAMFVIAVTVAATDNFGEPLEPTGLTLMVEDSGNAEVSQSDYALNFVDGSATTTITVGLTRRGDEGSIELSVASGDIQSAVSITLNPAPRVLVSITLSAASSKLVQTTANTAVTAVLMLTALDNYGDPIEAGDINLQIEATNAAIVTSSLTVAIATTAMIEILPQNELDTTVTVLISRGTLDESVQLLPDGGIQIAVRVLRVLRQLQLGLVNRVSPLRQIDRSLPIRANIRLIGLDQFGQPIAFSEVMLTATAEPMETTATLNPPQLTATGPEGAQTLLEVSFPGDSTMATTITIAIEGTDAGVSTNSLVVQALPDPRDPLRPLHVDDPETDVTELDLIVALRWLIDQQASTASLVVNLTIPSTDITTDGIKNLQQLFTEDIDRIDVNGDGRADQLDLRILLRYLSGLRGTELAEQSVFEDLIRLLLDRQP